jgi:hypothetical protein
LLNTSNGGCVVGVGAGSVIYASGDLIHVDYNITSSVGLLGTNPLQIGYSTNGGSSQTVLSSSLLNTSNGGCVVGVGATGCYEFNLPVGLVGMNFQIILSATDTNLAVTKTLTGYLNTQGLKLFAGKSSAIMGQSALATSFTDIGMTGLAMDSRGTVYASGTNRIYKIDGASGVVTSYMGNGTAGATGNGAPPSVTSFVTIGNSNRGLAVDNSDRLYWADSASVRRVNASGNVEVYLGGGTVSTPATGTPRTSFKNNGYVNGICFDSQNRMIFSYYISGALVILRVNADDTLEVLAGNYSAGATVNGADSRISPLGSSFSLVGTLAIKKGTQDILYIRDLDSKLYEVDLATHVIRYIANGPGPSNFNQILYDPVRDRIIYPTPGAVYFYRTDVTNSATSVASADAGYPAAVTRDSTGGLYYGTSAGLRLYYINPTNTTQSVFAGVSPSSGDGGLATSAELRVPQKLTLLNDGTLIFEDSGNVKLRKIGPTGIISSAGWVNIPGGNTGMMSATQGGAAPLYTNWYWTKTIINALTGGCIYFCGGGSYNPISAPDGVTATNLTAGNTVALTYDPVLNSNFILLSGGSYHVISEINSSGSINKRVNISLLAFATPSGVTSTSSLANYGHSYFHRLQAYNSTLYYYYGSSVLKLPLSGSIGTEISTSVGSFLVDGAHGRIYYSIGNQIYAKSLGVGTTGTLIATLPVTVSIQSMSPNAHAILFTSGNQIFEYSDPVNIY